MARKAAAAPAHEQTIEEILEEGKRELMASFPEIMRDIISDARTQKKKCSKCVGSGMVEAAECLACDGTGTISSPGDKHARDLIFKFAAEFATAQNGDSQPSGYRGTTQRNQEMMEP